MRTLFLKIIIKILILDIHKILLYIMRIITIIFIIYTRIKIQKRRNSIIKIMKLTSNSSRFFIILL